MHSIDKDRLLRAVGDSLLYEKKPCAVPFDSIRFTFGYERKPGLEIALTQLMFPSRTEEMICMAPRDKIVENVKLWCEEHGFEGFYNWQTDTFYFTGLLARSY